MNYKPCDIIMNREKDRAMERETKDTSTYHLLLYVGISTTVHDAYLLQICLKVLVSLVCVTTSVRKNGGIITGESARLLRTEEEPQSRQASIDKRATLF